MNQLFLKTDSSQMNVKVNDNQLFTTARINYDTYSNIFFGPCTLKKCFEVWVNLNHPRPPV